MAREAGFADRHHHTQRGRSAVPGTTCWNCRVCRCVRSTSLPVFWLKVATAYEDRDRA